MKLKTAHIQNYRSVRDTGVFDVEAAKTILVGPQCGLELGDRHLDRV